MSAVDHALLAAIADGSCGDPAAAARAFLGGVVEPAGVQIEEIWSTEGLHLPPSA